MQLKRLLKELAVPVAGSTNIGKKLRQYRGINVILLDEGEPPDVHGIPKEMEAYGRGWMDKNSKSIQIDGGPSGSRSGHPSTAENGFYWGADYNKQWNFQGKPLTGVIYVRGRAGTPTDFLHNNLTTILDLVFKRLPRP